jgi:hypothetical protein
MNFPTGIISYNLLLIYFENHKWLQLSIATLSSPTERWQIKIFTPFQYQVSMASVFGESEGARMVMFEIVLSEP